MSRPKISLYLLSVCLFMVLLPVIFIVVEWRAHNVPLDWALVGKWFIFWAIGVRLFTAGLRQASKPAFTAQIFNISNPESFIVIRELGLANISIGLMAMVTLFNPNAWDVPAAIAGGLYFGLAGMLHVVKRPESTNEVIAMASDLYIFTIMALYLLFILVL